MPKNKPYQLLLYQVVQIQVVGQKTMVEGIVAKAARRQVVVRLSDNGSVPDALVPGADIVIRCEDGCGLRVGTSKVLEIVAGPRPSLVIKSPRFNTIQNRHFFRMQVNFPCTLQLFGQGGKPVRYGKDDKARLLDLSGGGARVATSRALSVGDHVQLEFVSQLESKGRGAEGKTIQLIAEVLRVAPSPDSPAVFHAGLEFEILTEDAQDRLVTLLFNAQRTSNRNF